MIYTHAYTHACLHVCMYVRMYIRMYMYLRMYLYMYVCMYVCLYICIHVCMYIYICIIIFKPPRKINISTYMYIYKLCANLFVIFKLEMKIVSGKQATFNPLTASCYTAVNCAVIFRHFEHELF